MFRPESMEEAEKRYGKIAKKADGTFRWIDEIKWMKLVEMPSVMRNVLNTRNGKPVTTIYCNKDMERQLITTIELLHMRKLLNEIKTYDGCFNMRYVRGFPGQMSTHSYGLAIDFNAAQNPLGGKSAWSKEFVDTWKEMGFVWGGDFKSRSDAQHFQFLGPSSPSIA